MQPTKYLKYFNLFSLFDTKRTRDIFQVNPTLPPQRTEPEKIEIDIYDYTASQIEIHHFNQINQCEVFKNNSKVTWINVEGIRKADVEQICSCYNIHQLIVEDILSIGQRPS